MTNMTRYDMNSVKKFCRIEESLGGDGIISVRYVDFRNSKVWSLVV